MVKKNPAIIGLGEAIDEFGKENLAMKNPSTEASVESNFFLPSGLVDEDLKPGAKILIEAKLVDLGSKAELRPVEVTSFEATQDDVMEKGAKATKSVRV